MYTFNLHDMEKCWNEFSKDYSEESANIENEEMDFNDCDIYMQYVIFGEYVYGSFKSFQENRQRAGSLLA